MLFVAWLIVMRFRADFPVWLVAVGAILAGGGGLQGWAGLRGLGPSLTPYPEPAARGHLIDGGVYGLVRHPIYGGVGMGATGLGLAFGSWAAVTVGICILVYFRVKASDEERRLVAVYPDYPQYRNRVRAMLVPWVL